MREYHFHNSSGSSVTGVPHPRFLRVGILVWNAEGIKAVLRARPSLFSDVQLLPAVAVAREGASKKLVHQGIAQSSARVWIPSGGLRRDANHAHLLISEPKKGTPSTVLQMLKQRVSRKMRKGRARPKGQLSLRFPNSITGLPQFWQPRFYDFNVYSHKKKNEKLEYMHANPVVRGLVEHPKDWQRSISSICSCGVESNRRKGPLSQTQGRGKVKSPALQNRGQGTQIHLTSLRPGHPSF